MSNTQELQSRCRQIRLLLTDVDGILTDGRLIYTSDGVETKEFHVRDGLGIKLWRQRGYRIGIITARQSDIVKRRADELQVDILRQSSPNKLLVLQEIAKEESVDPAEICYIGDDLHDLAAIKHAGLGVTVEDAVDEIRWAANLVLDCRGGQGALRELVEVLLRAKGEWTEAIAGFE